MSPSPKSPSKAQAAAVGAALAKDLTLGDGKSAPTLLAGAAADTAAPLWLHKDAFSAAEFNADAYVNDLRRIVRPRPGPRGIAVGSPHCSSIALAQLCSTETVPAPWDGCLKSQVLHQGFRSSRAGVSLRVLGASAAMGRGGD